MSTQVDFPRLFFEHGFDDRDAFEAEARGYQSHVVVELDDGSRYRVVFYDPVRLQQDLEDEARLGRPFLAEPGLIVVSNVTQGAMLEAVRRLHREGFFTHLKPI